MKKIFPLQVEGKHPDRVLEAVKHDIRKYFKRERGRPVPAGADFWDFDCKVGASADSAQVVRVGPSSKRWTQRCKPAPPRCMWKS